MHRRHIFTVAQNKFSYLLFYRFTFMVKYLSLETKSAEKSLPTVGNTSRAVAKFILLYVVPDGDKVVSGIGLIFCPKSGTLNLATDVMQRRSKIIEEGDRTCRFVLFKGGLIL